MMGYHCKGTSGGFVSIWRVLYSRRLFRMLPKLGVLAAVIALLLFLDKSYQQSRKVVINLSENYFPKADLLEKISYLVNNDKCKVPDLPLWESRYLLALETEGRRTQRVPCDPGRRGHVSFVKGENLIINELALLALGYTWEDVNCYYQSVERIEQTEDKYDKQADNLFGFSASCDRMAKITQPGFSFIRVTCTSCGFLTWGKRVYRNYHLIAHLPNERSANSSSSDHNNKSTRNISRKLAFWRNGTTSGIKPCVRPPNVLLIGIDSTSRLHFHRHLKSTMIILEKLKAVEMKGYTKVGDNSYSNLVPLLTSLSVEELHAKCVSSRWSPFDKCPWIWKEFDKLNYLTAHLEDAPKRAILNYRKTGFIRQPVDIYLRPWMLAAYGDKWYVDCIGDSRPEKIILDYITELAALSNSQCLPFFITTWLNDLTKEDVLGLQSMDFMLSNTLSNLNEMGLLDNTLLLVMSNHGYKFADIRATTYGWYEDKLPAMFIKLPITIANKRPEWEQALLNNSNQLTTAFDVHATLKDVLALTANETGQQVEELSHVTPKSNSRGHSLFQKLPQRSCYDAGIHAEFCACSSPVAYPSTPAENMTLLLIKEAAQKVIRSVNAKLPSVCEHLHVSEVFAAAKYPQDGVAKESSFLTTFIVSLIANPGNFQLEARLIYSNVLNGFSEVLSVTRTNKVQTPMNCLNENDLKIEVDDYICYCK